MPQTGTFQFKKMKSDEGLLNNSSYSRSSSNQFGIDFPSLVFADNVKTINVQYFNIN